MSIESAKVFAERMKTDQEFANKVNGLTNREEVQSFISNQGYDFTVEELKECSLLFTDEDLDAVVGGDNSRCAAHTSIFVHINTNPSNCCVYLGWNMY